MNLKIKKYFETVNPLKFRDEKVTKVSELARGESNINYLVQTNKNKYLMRCDITDKSAAEFAHEYEILKIIEKLNISQKALFIDTSKKHFKDNFMIIEYLPGTNTYKVKRKAFMQKINKLAEELAKLHKLDIKFVNKNHSFKKRLTKTRTTIKKLKKELAGKKKFLKIIKIYQQRFKKLNRNYKKFETFCHGDVCMMNILFFQKKFFLIDWESAGKSDPALELSYCTQEFMLNQKEREQFIKTYLKHRKDPNLRERMKFTDFYNAFSEYFSIIEQCTDIAKKRKREEYLKTANLEEYWDWGKYYLTLIFGLNIIDKTFENELKKELKSVHDELVSISKR